MRCIDAGGSGLLRCVRSAGRLLAWPGLCALIACSAPLAPGTRTAPGSSSEPSIVAIARAGPGAPARRGARTMDEYRLHVAARLVEANPGITYTTPAPGSLLAIPVLEVEVNGDGSIRRIAVLRTPRQAEDTVRIAIDALHRAAPFGDATHLPRPWKFTEVFLFDEERRFKPRELD